MLELIVRESVPLMGVSLSITALGTLMGRSCKLLPATDIKSFALSVLAINLSGIIGRELSLNSIEKEFDSKNPGIRYISLSLGVAGMAAALTSKVSLGRFIWNGVSNTEALAYGMLSASSLSIFDHYIWFPASKDEAQKTLQRAEIELQEYLDDRITQKKVENEPVSVEAGDWRRHFKLVFKHVFNQAKHAVDMASRYGISTTGKPIIEMLQEAETYLTNLENIRPYEEENFEEKTGVEMLAIQRRIEIGEVSFNENQKISWNRRWVELHFSKDLERLDQRWQELGFGPDPALKDLINFGENMDLVLNKDNGLFIFYMGGPRIRDATYLLNKCLLDAECVLSREEITSICFAEQSIEKWRKDRWQH